MLRPSHAILLAVVASLCLVISFESAPASAAIKADPSWYRYTGVVENGRGVPARYTTRGGGLIFFFFDASAQGSKSEPYRLCVGRTGRSPTFCWNRTARYGVGKISFSFTLPSHVPLGALTARWLIAGRTVASWQFLYARGEG